MVLDGVVADEGPDADPWTKAADVTTDASGLRAYRVGRRIVFGGRVPDGRAVRRGAFSVAPIDLESRQEPKSR